jgi:hypothetical protein
MKLKPKNESKTTTGRPLAVVDAKLVENLAGIGCPNSEIASIVGVSVDTLARRFAEDIDKGRNGGKTRLRKKQIELALAGNVTMLIWLGKQLLGQSDQISNHTELSGTIRNEGGGFTPEQSEALDGYLSNLRSGLIPPGQ